VAALFRIAVVFSLSLITLGQLVWGATKPEEVARAVEQLGSKNYRQRQKASAFLWAAGKAAEPALQKALQSDDKEVVRRARDILEKFKYGIYPDTPKRVVELIQEYRSGREDGNHVVIQELNRLGSPGHAVLIKLAGMEKDTHVRRELFDVLSSDVVPGLLGEGRHNEVEELLEMGVQGHDEQALRNYAAYVVFSGRLESKLPAWTKKAKKLTGYKAAEVLMYLHRANGDLKNARKAAGRTENKYLVACILIEQGDWKELSANPEVPDESPTDLGPVGYQAAYHRLAGNTKDFDKALADLAKYNARQSYYTRQQAIAYLVNSRPREAIDLVLKNKEKSFAFHLLAAQQRYKEAFEQVGDQPAASWEEPLALGRARIHVLLGEKDKAVKVLADYFKGVKSRRDISPYLKVIQTEQQLHLTEEAFVHCAEILDQARREEQLASLFGKVFPDRAGEAAAWWQFFRKKHGAGKEPAALKRLRTLLDGKVPAKEFTALAAEMAKAAADMKEESERQQAFQALGETSLAYEQKAMAQTYLEKAGTQESLVRLGNLLAGKKLWQQAAERYRLAWTKDRSKPLPQYLRGDALVRAGFPEQGKKWIDIAHLLPLANDKVRFDFYRALDKRGFDDGARRELELITRTGLFNYVEMSNALRFLGMAAYARKDFDKAAFYYERTLLICLGRVIFINPAGYLSVPASVHHLRARSFLARGKIDDALKEVNEVVAAFPGDIEGSINIVPELEKRDRKKQADELFNRAFNHYSKLCKAYPNSVQFHNSLAWLSVCCRRHLDTAMEHARKAVELDPRNAGCLDTLAEIYYQRGDREQALKLMRRCVELDPKKKYFRKQIKRFEAKGPPSETPRSGEE
jgi:tetratricopeptide (TPR) repeat protein